jgi:sulfur-carrier protein adenylyltransferase/sulfurtransferase
MAFLDRLEGLRREIAEVSVEEVRALLDGTEVVLVDVRQTDEAAQGRIEGSLAIPRGWLEIELTKHVASSAQLVFYCAGGTRSLLAADAARRAGFSNVASMAGGFGRWKTQGAPFAVLPVTSFDGFEASVDPISAAEMSVAELLAAGAEGPVVVDVREEEETALGFIRDAQLIPRGFLEMHIESACPDLRAPLCVVSSRGARAAWAAQDLRRLGYENVTVLRGGMMAWEAAGHEVHHPRRLSVNDRLRYSRHLSIDEVGEEGQLRLLDSKVLLMGAGGLGSPAAYYLAAAGIGTLGIIDSDVVDRSNLQRQILHADDRVGTPKVTSARQTLLGLNPDIDVVAYNARLTSANVEEVFAGYDLVIDGGDNFPTRYLVNDACVHLGLPCVHGSVYRFEGQVTVFSPATGGPCYRCLYPEPPPPELAPSCADAGVLGVVPGIIGLMQANEAIKVLLGIGDTLAGRLLHFDGLRMKFRELKLRPDPECPMCSEGALWSGYVDYEQFCAVSL